jgi:hypothetical protein
MVINFLKAVKRYFDRVQFFAFKLRHHLKYSLAFSNRRTRDHRLREIAHSVDKAQKLNTYDPKRIASRFEQIKCILSETQDISDENQRFLRHLGLIPFENAPTVNTDSGLPSIRHFSQQSVDPIEIEHSIEVASLYPKSCSRESVRLVQFAESKKEASSCFSGMTAFEFGEYELFAVVVDLTAYDQRAEVFAPYVDGAILSTAFCEALWHRGIGSCMLNWSSQSKNQERRLRILAGLSETDLVIMGIVVGHPVFVPFHAPRKHPTKLLRRV